jgi:molybdenum cofactor cytidylyltransferase
VRQVAAVILAAGEAKRFRRSPDETKLVAELDGKPIVRHVADAALASRGHPVLLVTGHAHEQVASALDGLMLERIHNHDPGARPVGVPEARGPRLAKHRSWRGYSAW